MKKILLLISVFAFITAQAQTVDDIIQKYSTAMGGLENFNKLQSLKTTGTVTTQGLDLPMTIQVINNRAVRTDIDVMGQKIVNCYIDGKGWTINPFAGITSATDVTGTELSEFKSQSMIASQLMDYKSRGHQVELLGQENVDGAKAYKIKLTNKDDSKVTTYFIDATSSLVIRSISTIDLQGVEMEVQTNYSDYKDFGGLKFIMARVQTVEGQTLREIKYDSLELNVAIDEKIFEKE